MAPPVRRPGARATDKRISARASPATHALGPRGGADHGETVLHFAVVKNDLQMVQLLLDCGAHPDQAHANGLFFYERIEMYMGGSPIGFAACLGHERIVDLLHEQARRAPARLRRTHRGMKPCPCVGPATDSPVLPLEQSRAALGIDAVDAGPVMLNLEEGHHATQPTRRRPSDAQATPTGAGGGGCLLYTSPSPRDQRGSRMPSSA